MNPQNKIKILIVGAFGTLGSLVTKHCLAKPNLLVNIFVRNPDKNKELADAVEKAGGKVFQGDITQPDTFKGVGKGIHTVIFTLPPIGAEINIKGQTAMIDECVANGVKRIIPSNFTWNFSKFPREELSPYDFIDGKLKVQEHLKSLPVKTLVIDTGIFLDSLFRLTLGKDFNFWGDPNQKYQTSSFNDIAQFTACATTRENLDGHLVVAVHDLSINELVAIYNKVRGINIVPKRLGSLEDLKAKSEELKPKGDFEAIITKVRSLFFTEKSRFEKVNTDDFPEFKGTSVEEFLKQNPDI